MGKLSLIILIILLIALGFTSYYAYQNFPNGFSEVQNLVLERQTELPKVEGISASIIQFYPNMRFNHNKISYFINDDCDNEKSLRVTEAFQIIESEVKSLSFLESNNEEADIFVGCSSDVFEKDETVFIAGEGGPSKIINSSLYPIILQGKVMLYEDPNHNKKSQCEKPITEIHELLHVFGFDHINDTEKIMYPYINCDQEIGQEYLNLLEELYSVEALPELYFKDVKASKSGRYLDLNVSIRNEGLVDAENVKLNIYADDKFIDNYDLETIEFGAGKVFFVTNFDLKTRTSEIVKLELKSSIDDLDSENNIIELLVQ